MANITDVLEELTKLPYWLAKPFSELNKIRKASIVFWQRFNDFLAWPLQQIDPMTAELELVHLLAWERDITEIFGETETIYRTRVKNALKFARAAGSVDGWQTMFEDLGMPWVKLEERLTYLDWDIVSLKVTDLDLAERLGLIENITRKYGRTTRRYHYTTIADLEIVAAPYDFSAESTYTIATTD